MRLLLFLALITQAFAVGKLTKHQFTNSKIFAGTGTAPPGDKNAQPHSSQEFVNYFILPDSNLRFTS